MCLDSTMVAGFGGFEGGGGSATVLRTETYEVVSWLYGEDVVEVWGRSENVCVFPATPAAAARWSAVVPVEREGERDLREREWGRYRGERRRKLSA